MSEGSFTESVVEDAALAWLESLGYSIKHGPDISPAGNALTLALSQCSQWERENYSEVILGQRLREALARLNPALPDEAIDEAFTRAVWRWERLLKHSEFGIFSEVSVEAAE